MNGDLVFSVIVDHQTGRITPVSNMRNVGDMIRMLNVLDQITMGIRTAVYETLQNAEPDRPAQPQAETDE